MSDKFTVDHFNWLRQVASDSGLPPVASRIAIALTKYFSRKNDGWAWMSQAALAADLGVTDRTVRSALAELVHYGHLTMKRRGFKETNVYRLVLHEGDRKVSSGHDRKEIADHDRQDFSGHDEMTGKFAQSERKERSGQTGKNFPPNPLSEPTEEPIEERDSSDHDLDREDSGRRDGNSSSEIHAEFEVWFAQYPKRTAKDGALKAYRAARKRATAEKLLTGAMRAAEAYGRDAARRGPETAHQFVKGPARWLNEGCWADEPVDRSPGSTPTSTMDIAIQFAALAHASEVANG